MSKLNLLNRNQKISLPRSKKKRDLPGKKGNPKPQLILILLSQFLSNALPNSLEFSQLLGNSLELLSGMGIFICMVVLVKRHMLILKNSTLNIMSGLIRGRFRIRRSTNTS